ncbi:hypothetical protein [Hydrogenophaga sp.]|uniref:hypothetical protein n=1 Tax=Hydrogenophaga sp. TaxID=1904254 RepID=UPI00356830F5
MSRWVPAPFADSPPLDADRVRALWAQLHRGDAEPLPNDPELFAAWVLFHNGHFEDAALAGQALGARGATLANKATCVYANYVEPREKNRLDLFMVAAERALAQQNAQPINPNAWYWQGYALGRYSQGISVAKALAMGLGARVRAALEHTLELAPDHADAHLALGNFHAEVIDKVGAMIGGMTYGVRKDAGLEHYQRARQLNPESTVTLTEYANGLLMLDGERRLPEAMVLMEQASAIEPLDAMDRLYLESARMDLGA